MFTLSQPSSYELRDYQQALIADVLTCWQKGDRRVMLQLATGGGKTVLFSSLAAEFTVRGEGVLVVAHREELLLQAQEKLAAIVDQPVGIIKTGYKPDPSAPIQVASIQTLCRRFHLPPAGLLVIDEAHHSAADSYIKLLRHYERAYALGVTATPARSDGQGFKTLYDTLICGPSTSELIAAKYLCPYRLFAAPKAVNTAGVETLGGDYNQRQLAEAVNTSLVLGDLLDTWRKYAKGKKTVVFGVDVAHSRAIADTYLAAGIPAEHLDGETPSDERAAILNRFRRGETLILCNCGIVSEGFDVPSIEAIQCVRPTKSLILWLQIVGRALRPTSEKKYAVIIDHTQNFVFHGLPCDEREWSLDAVSMGGDGKWLIVCPSCDHVFRPLSHERSKGAADCPNCGTRIQLEPELEGEGNGRELESDEQAEIQEINLDVNPLVLTELQRLRFIQQQRGYKNLWVYHELRKNFPILTYGDLRRVGQELGYKPGWAWYKWQELQQQRAA